MARNGYRSSNWCERCKCPLDAGEGRYCNECLEEMQKEEMYARQWNMTVQQAREVMKSVMVSA